MQFVVAWGLILLALWLFTQLDPDSLVFASGDLRQLFALPTALPFSALEFLRLETAITASHSLPLAGSSQAWGSRPLWSYI